MMDKQIIDRILNKPQKEKYLFYLNKKNIAFLKEIAIEIGTTISPLIDAILSVEVEKLKREREIENKNHN